MVFEYLALLAAVALPYVAWLRWRQSIKTVYQGPAQITWLDKSQLDKDTHYMFFQVPGIKKALIEKVPSNRFDERLLLTSLVVTVKKRPFGQAWVEQVSWEDGHPEPLVIDTTGDGLAITAYYMLGGVVVALASMRWQLGHAGFFLSALAITLAGFCLNRFRFAKKDLGGETRLLKFINVGKGAPGLLGAAIVLAVITGACFWVASIFMFFPGINCAFELGGMCAALATAIGPDEKATEPKA